VPKCFAKVGDVQLCRDNRHDVGSMSARLFAIMPGLCWTADVAIVSSSASSFSMTSACGLVTRTEAANSEPSGSLPAS
jgi:hypothetical protein